MEPQQLDLRDIHLPEVIDWWPPAIGWWILAILIPLCCWFFVWLYKRITRKTAVKTAKKLLRNIKQDNTLDDKQKLIALSALLRRVAISISPRDEIASLNGHAWLQYLDKTIKGTPFTSGAGSILANGHYQQSTSDYDINALIKVCDNWLSSQKKGGF